MHRTSFLTTLLIALPLACGSGDEADTITNGNAAAPNAGESGAARSKPLRPGESLIEGDARLRFLSVVRGPIRGHADREYIFVCFEIENVSETVVLKSAQGPLLECDRLEDEFGNSVDWELQPLSVASVPVGVTVSRPPSFEHDQALKPGERIRDVLYFKLPPIKKAASFVVRAIFATDHRRQVGRAEFRFGAADVGSVSPPQLAGTWEGSHGKTGFVMQITQEGQRLAVQKTTEKDGVFSKATLTGTVTPAAKVSIDPDWTGTFARNGVVSGFVGRLMSRWSMRRVRGTANLLRRHENLKRRFGTIDLSGMWDVYFGETDSPWAFQMKLTQSGDRIRGQVTASDRTGTAKGLVQGTVRLDRLTFRALSSEGKVLRPKYMKAYKVVLRSGDHGVSAPFAVLLRMRRWKAGRSVERWVAIDRYYEAKAHARKRRYGEALKIIATYYKPYAADQLGYWTTLLAARCEVRQKRPKAAMDWLESGVAKSRPSFSKKQWRDQMYVLTSKSWTLRLKKGEATKGRFRAFRKRHR